MMLDGWLFHFSSYLSFSLISEVFFFGLIGIVQLSYYWLKDGLGTSTKHKIGLACSVTLLYSMR